jgi:hypothetical protein
MTKKMFRNVAKPNRAWKEAGLRALDGLFMHCLWYCSKLPFFLGSKQGRRSCRALDSRRHATPRRHAVRGASGIEDGTRDKTQVSLPCAVPQLGQPFKGLFGSAFF